MTAYPYSNELIREIRISNVKTRTFHRQNRASESIDSILSILECVLNLSQSFYEEIFFSVGMKFSKSTFDPYHSLGTSFDLENFMANAKHFSS